MTTSGLLQGLGLSLAHSSEYLNSVPSRYFGLAMLPQNFRLTLQYRLGIPVYPTRDPICPACATPMDVYGDHSLACSTENERICRHDALRDAIFEQASHAGLFPKKEARSLIPDSQRRPGDIYIPHWRNRPPHSMLPLPLPFESPASKRVHRRCARKDEAEQNFQTFPILSPPRHHIRPSSRRDSRRLGFGSILSPPKDLRDDIPKIGQKSCPSNQTLLPTSFHPASTR